LKTPYRISLIDNQGRMIFDIGLAPLKPAARKEIVLSILNNTADCGLTHKLEILFEDD